MNLAVQFILLVSSFVLVVFCEYIPPGPRYVCPERKENIFPCKCLKGTDQGLYVHCENSNLASLSVAFKNLATHQSPIEELTISKSHFQNLYGTLFYKLKIRILTIEDTPLVKIDDLLFRGVNRTLQELYILNTNLKEFPKVAFKILGNLTHLKIDHHEINSLDKDIFFESAANERLERLHLSNGRIGELMSESFQTLRKLKTLDLHGNNLTVLKRNQFKNLRDVEVLDISHNNISKLDSSHIADLTKMSWCNISHNALNELTRGTFARNSVLRVLNMSHNKIKRLDINSFRGMRFLRRLYLNDNNITEIGRGTFTSITRIGTIDLARNQIKKIDYQMFAQLNYVEIIDVSENKVTEIQKQSFKDLYLTHINLSKNMISKFESNSFENCANMTKLDLSNNLIELFPKSTFDENSYATELALSFNLFTDLSQVPLHNMTGLKILNVSYNQITEIPKNTFPKLYELHTIDMSHNNLTTIANAVFQVLFSLRNLNLSYNSLDEIKNSVFGTVPTLLDMDLSNNKLTTIGKGALTKLSSLRFLTLENNSLSVIFEIPISLNYLNLRYNQISEIPDMTWPSMNAMLGLDLTGNRLMDNLKGETFRNLLTLQRLNLDENGITKVPWESLSVLSTLQYIYLKNNNITSLGKGAFGKLPVVFEVNLYNNQISDISERAFDGLLQLLNLNMSSNSIKQIPIDAFIGLVSLRVMDLSHNFIEKLDNKTNGALDNCLSLEKINLSHNKISFVTLKTFPADPYIPYKLEEIDLSYNEMPVITFDITIGAKKVKRLNLSHNFINDIRKNVLGNLTSLEVLDLSYNDLDDLNPENYPFQLPDNLTEMYLNNNRLHRLPNDAVHNLTKLNVLDISDNVMGVFNYTLLNKIPSGLKLLVNENPIVCNCNIRPLKHYLATLIEIPSTYSTIICDLPVYLRGQNLINISDDSLQCSRQEHKGNASIDDFDLLPDLRFREVFYLKDNLFVQWYVTALFEDIADFYISIRDSNNDLLTERRLSYDDRVVQISGSDISDDYVGQLELCVLAKKSNGDLRTWFDTQCIYLPDNFDTIKRQYGLSRNQPFRIHSIKKGIKAQTVASENGKKKLRRKSSKSSGLRNTITTTFISLLIGYLSTYCV